MIDFSLTEEQEALRNLAREFTQKEIVPKAKHYDETGEYPWEIVKKAWEIGLLNTHIPEQYGGAGLGSLEDCIIMEEFGAGCTGMATAMGANNLASAPIILFGNDDQKKRFLAPLTEQPLMAAYAVTEPSAGSDVQGIKTVGKKMGDEYIITGEKMWITNAGVASWYLVLAYTDSSKGYKGMTTFLVPRDAPGIEVGKKEQNMGQRASDTRAIVFNEVKIPKANILGNEGEGWKVVMTAFDKSRPGVSAMAVGLARSAMEHSIKYSQERSAFGVPIFKHEGISFMIAEMARDIEAARLLVWYAAWMIDKGIRNTKYAAIAKLFAADSVARITTDAVQIFGGYGYNKEYPVEKLMRDAKIFQIYEGTSQIQRLIIAKEIFERK
jgi:acyl-CoA dehydrogenase